MSILTMEASHAFTAVDLDAVLDEFEFHEGEAERQVQRHSLGGGPGGGNTTTLKKESSVIFSPSAEEEQEEDNTDRIAVEEAFWEAAAAASEPEASKDVILIPDAAEAVLNEEEVASETEDPAPPLGNKEDPPNSDSDSSSSSSSSESSEDCIGHSHEATPEEEGGARPKSGEDVPLDSPPPYSEIDPMKKEEENSEEVLRKLSRPTSLALPPPPANNGHAEGEEGAVGSRGDESPDVGSLMGPPGSTPAIPNVSLVPDLLQGLSEEQLVLGKVPPRWVPDGEALTCMICDTKFTLTKRRHHCRACGKVLCSHCCSGRFLLPHMDNKEARVCKPCKGILERLKRAEELNNNSSSSRGAESAPVRPNPSNPMEYCSTIPPEDQASAHADPPSVMVPVGVLKRWDPAALSSPDRRPDPKQVMFSDGIRPGGDLTELDGSPPEQSRFRSRAAHKGSSKRAGQCDIARSMLPLDGLPYVAGLGPANPSELEESFAKGESTPFLINLNLKVHVSLKFYTPANGFIWSYRTDGMNSVGNDEIIFLLTQRDAEELLPPRDIFNHIQKLFEEIRRGTSVHEMGHSVVLSGADFLGGSDYGGFLFIRHSFQCIQSLDLPDTPYLFGLLITKAEVPWARVFPLRLVLRLGAEFRYYPCPLWSSRSRPPVYKESGNTIMKILSDFRNFTYSLPIIKGLVVHVEDKLTTVLLPKTAVKFVQKALQNSSDPVLALGANFSPVADSHFIAVQRDEAEALRNPSSSSDYETQTINRFNHSRKVTGASFIVFNGALKSTSGLTAKSSIVEDGIMVQISQDKMMEIRKKLYATEDTEIGCGPVGAPTPDEIVSIRWVEEDRAINAGIKSPIDSLPMDGIVSVRIHSGPDFRGDGGHIIRCTEIFFFPSTDEPSADNSESSKVAELLSKSVCGALAPHLKSLRCKSDIGVLGVRITLEPDNVGYDAGGKGMPLSAEFMNSLDNELIPIIHRQSIVRRTKFEMIFHILNT